MKDFCQIFAPPPTQINHYDCDFFRIASTS